MSDLLTISGRLNGALVHTLGVLFGVFFVSFCLVFRVATKKLPGVCRVEGREACHAWVGKVRAEPKISLFFFRISSTQIVEHVNNPQDQTEGRVDSRAVC